MKRKFEQPTVEQLREYAKEIGFSGFNPNAFLDHYELVGWVVGKARTPMASWRAAVRIWQRKQAEWSGAAPQVEDDPAVLDYAREARERIAAGGYEIARFWAKVRNAIGPAGLERVKRLAKERT